jgi:hypothetical protein
MNKEGFKRSNEVLSVIDEKWKLLGEANENNPVCVVYRIDYQSNGLK